MPEKKRGVINDIGDAFEDLGDWFWSADKDNAKRTDGAMKQDEEENDLEKKRGVFNDIGSFFWSEDKDNDLEKKRGVINDIGSFFWSEDKDNAKRTDGAMKRDEEDNDLEQKRAGEVGDWMISLEDNDLEKKRGILNDAGDWFANDFADFWWSADKDDMKKRNMNGPQRKGRWHRKGKGPKMNKAHPNGKWHKNKKAHRKGHPRK